MEADGNQEPTGDVALVKRSTPEHEAQINKMLDSLSLGPDAVESVLVYYDADGSRTSVRAMTGSGSVSVSADVETPQALQEELQKILEEHREAIRNELKVGVARTWVSNAG